MSKSTSDVNNHIGEKITYYNAPKKSIALKRNFEIVDIITNLFKITFDENELKLFNFSYSIQPEIANDNFTLLRKIQREIESDLSRIFKKKYFSGYNLFASAINPAKEIIINANVENTDYVLTFKQVREFDIKIDSEEDQRSQQKKKTFVERVIKEILLKNPNTIKFGDDRTIVQVDPKNIITGNDNNKETIFKGYLTSNQITSIGFCLLVLNINKHVRNITVYEKINQIRNEHKNLQESEIRKIIDEYFQKHKTVLTIYGSYRTYRIDSIDFDASPKKVSFNLKTNEGEKSITIEEYYKKQYKINIKDLEQPLIKVETKLMKKKKEQKKLGNINLEQNQNGNKEEEKTIYLIPELLYMTGNPTELDNKNRKPIKKISKPQEKMGKINDIRKLLTSNKSKIITDRLGQERKCKSPLEVSQEWGISLGNNLVIKGKILPQPNLLFYNNQVIIPNNGKFTGQRIKVGMTLDEKNFIFFYDAKDRSPLRNLVKLFLDKAKYKGLNIRVDPEKIKGIEIKNFNKWDDILKILETAQLTNIKMALVFLTPQLEKYYSNMKDYFTNRVNFPSQFIISNKLKDHKKAGNIMFNVVEQINIKMGGTNFTIDFYKENILEKGKIYMILGLEISKSGRGLDLVMTSSVNPNLNKVITSIASVPNTLEDKEKALNELVDLALNALKKNGSPSSPDYIILYRHGGNKVDKEKLRLNEVPIFTKILNNKFKKKLKFIYISCTLKCDFKFFEQDKKSLNNPKSGLCIDNYITQKGKKEFYIQPQFVNQGTATPCLYEVLYEDIDNDNPDDNISTENLQLLTFYLTFYYWTWAGAIREPGALKLASKASDFYNKNLCGKLVKENKQFINPEYI